ncbi:MAG: peptidase T [Clostridia bacterium]|nr:peptidase T [Clostridia bacterium]
MDIVDRFLAYVALDTSSDENSPSCPSTAHQFDLAALLRDQLAQMGAKNVRMDEHAYVYAEIPANRENQPVIGLIAHMDVVDCVPSSGIQPRRLRYEGGDITLNEALGIVMREKDYPALRALTGQELIVTDGTTLLGADDKAGVTEIMELAQFLLTHPDFPHGTVKIGFTPDEEIGRGADLFDVAGFGADFAYTVDGDIPGGIEYENFNAAAADVEIKGHNIHPGSAKNKMRNAIKLGIQFQQLLPALECPENTEGYEGFYHLQSFQGNEESASLKYILRDHDKEKLALKKARMLAAADYLNVLYGEDTVTVSLRDQYENMRSVIERNMHVVTRAQEAARRAGLTPVSVPVRGGTDGARLSFMGLPCPNLGTGGGNYHGTFEYVSVDGMKQVVEVLKEIVRATGVHA